jgi:hypothetical protein
MSYCPELANERFMDRLRNQRVDELIDPKNKKYLAQLRYNIDAVSVTLKVLGRTLRQRGIDLHQIILEASGDWDEEDEQKYGDCPAAAFYQKNTRPATIKNGPIGDDDVVAARKGDVLGGQGEGLELQVRASASRRRQDVEKEKERSGFLFR